MRTSFFSTSTLPPTKEDILAQSISQKMQKIYELDQPAYFKIVDDPIAKEQVPMVLPKKNGAIKRACKDISSFTLYSKTLNKTPTASLFNSYLDEMYDYLKENKTKRKITASEKEYVAARKTWSDVVSSIDKNNAAICSTQNVKNEILKRLASLGFKNKTEVIYERCLTLLKNNSAIVINFNASFLAKEALHNFQLLNLFERGFNNFSAKKTNYKTDRETTENTLFKSLNDDLKEALNNIHAKPRYGTLILLDRNHTIEKIGDYGNSFMVLHDIAKFACLFNVRDSMNAVISAKKEIMPCSFHHMQLLLFQMTDKRLKAIAAWAATGALPNDFIQNLSTYHVDKEEYIEVLIPGFSVFDSKLFNHLHLNNREYQVNPSDAKLLSDLGVTVTNDHKNPYPELCSRFMAAIEKNNIEEVLKLAKNFPSLMKISNTKGEQPLHIAAKLGHLNLISLLAKNNADINALTADGYAPIHYAILYDRIETVQAITKIKQANLNIKTSREKIGEDGLTPLMIACSYQKIQIVKLLLNCHADPSIASSNGQTPLAISVACFKDCLELLINAKRDLNVNSIIENAHTALIIAMTRLDVNAIQMMLTIPGIDVNYKNTDGESALFIAAKSGFHEKVKVLLKHPDIDYAAKRIPGDGKTALQIAEKNGNKQTADLLKTHQLEHQFAEIKNIFDREMTSSRPFKNKSLETISNLYDSLKSVPILMTRITVFLGCLLTEHKNYNASLSKQFFKWKSQSQFLIQLEKTLKEINLYLLNNELLPNLDDQDLCDIYLAHSNINFADVNKNACR